ncbi:MAG: RNA methyltransferase [Ruminococcus sp.]|nr:RNA methyltransferase [Ruminococcus sp.]
MAEIIEITDLSAIALVPYTNTSEAELKKWQGTDCGVFVAESPKVIRTAVEEGFMPISFLCERKYITGQASDILAAFDNVPVYTADSEVLTELTGFRMTQGILCTMKRRPLPTPSEILSGASRIAVLENIMNQTNIGAIFRSAAALGFDAVLLTPSCSDPLYRRSVRVSMGTVFSIPWTYLESAPPDYVKGLAGYGFRTAAMALRNDTISIEDEALQSTDKLVVLFGTEGTGLCEETINACDYTIKIPMYHGVDSLNVAAASAVAFWQLRKKQ